MKHMKQRYTEDAVPALQKDGGFANVMQVPKLEKIVINVGVGEASHNSKLIDGCVNELTRITGQKAIKRLAKKSVAGFKLREGMPVGTMVTLRGDRMYDFLTKLVIIAIPRIRDFRGLNPNSFDGRGNYNLGLKDQLIFPEINYDEVSALRGMNITIVTSATNDADGLKLLTELGFPFKKPKKAAA